MSKNTTSPAASLWLPVKPAGWVRADRVVALDRSGNKYRLQTSDGVWHDCRRDVIDRVLGKAAPAPVRNLT